MTIYKLHVLADTFAGYFGTHARVTQLDIDFDRSPTAVRSVVIAPRARAAPTRVVEQKLAARLDQPVVLQLDQVLLDPAAGSLDTQRAELRRASEVAAAEDAAAANVARLVALAAGVPNDSVSIDRAHRRATAIAAPLPGASPEVFRVLEARAAANADGWQVTIVPPFGPMPVIRFANDADDLDGEAKEAVILSAWEAQRWNIRSLSVPGFAREPAARPSLAARRGGTIALLLRDYGIDAVPAPAAGAAFALSPSVSGAQ